MEQKKRNGRRMMCEYCGHKKTELVETPEVGVFICGDMLIIFDYSIGEIASVEKVNFCPMCGRKLDA